MSKSDSYEKAIRELRQTFPLLKRLKEAFDFPEVGKQKPKQEFERLQVATNRIKSLCYELSGNSYMQGWVGEMGYMGSSFDCKIRESDCALVESLYFLVQGILENEKTEEIIVQLSREHAVLREQLTEQQKRETTYLTTIERAQASSSYSLSIESKDILLTSLQRQKLLLTKNLMRLQETKAQYGLNTPLDVLNGIDQTQNELERVSKNINDLQK